MDEQNLWSRAMKTVWVDGMPVLQQAHLKEMAGVSLGVRLKNAGRVMSRKLGKSGGLWLMWEPLTE